MVGNDDDDDDYLTLLRLWFFFFFFFSLLILLSSYPPPPLSPSQSRSSSWVWGGRAWSGHSLSFRFYPLFFSFGVPFRFRLCFVPFPLSIYDFSLHSAMQFPAFKGALGRLRSLRLGLRGSLCPTCPVSSVCGFWAWLAESQSQWQVACRHARITYVSARCRRQVLSLSTAVISGDLLSSRRAGWLAHVTVRHSHWLCDTAVSRHVLPP